RWRGACGERGAWRKSRGLQEESGDDRVVDDAPLAAFAGPELALLRAGREVVGAVLLLESDHHEVGRAGIGKDAQLLDADLDPRLARVHLALARAPRRVAALVGPEMRRVVREVA